jgi:hypothetical protein
VDSLSFNGMTHQHGQGFGDAPAQADDEQWAGEGFTARPSAETLGPEDPRE